MAKDARNKTAEKCFTVTVKPVPSRLTNVSVIDAGAIRLGRTVTVTADAAGGSAPYSYYFLYKLSEKNSYNDLSKGYVRTATRVFKPGKTGTYDIIRKGFQGSCQIKTNPQLCSAAVVILISDKKLYGSFVYIRRRRFQSGLPGISIGP